MIIRHRVEGRTYYTYYGHLRSIAPEIAVGTGRYETRVKRGQFIGWAGKTGDPNTAIHLHFELLAAPVSGWIPTTSMTLAPRIRHRRIPRDAPAAPTTSGASAHRSRTYEMTSHHQKATARRKTPPRRRSSFDHPRHRGS